jgi:hypothetical protein
VMLQKAKEYGFFLAVFVLVVYGISFLAPNTAGNPISLRELLAPYIPGALAILKTGLLAIAITVASLVTGLLAIAFRDRLAYRMNQSIAKTASQSDRGNDKPIRVNINGWHIQEKRVAESDSQLQVAIQERDEWQRKYHALLSSQRLAQASTAAPEGASGALLLTYASVVALLQERPTSINRAQEIVRKGGGTVPRDYSPLREIVKLLRPSPIEENTPIHEVEQAVNGEWEPNRTPVNEVNNKSFRPTMRSVPELSPEQVARFWKKVSTTQGSRDCWLWMGAKKQYGYGMCNINDKTYLAHRIAYTLACGPIPDGLLVCHKCDTPACCNPAHLFVGTDSDNVEDMMRKGRHRKEKHANLSPSQPEQRKPLPRKRWIG